MIGSAHLFPIQKVAVEPNKYWSRLHCAQEQLLCVSQFVYVCVYCTRDAHSVFGTAVVCGAEVAWPRMMDERNAPNTSIYGPVEQELAY